MNLPNNKPVEFRSDTFTLPTQAMKEVMLAAPLGDDVFGEDPSINQLQNFAADYFGMEAALFAPSGTMTNQIAINVHTQPGDEVICDEGSHVYYYEGGGIAKNSGAQVRLIQGDRGRITAKQIAELINPDDVHRARTSLVTLENTCNRGGGACYNLNDITAIAKLCKDQGLKLHLDGARLMNAIVAGNQDPKWYGEHFDSISVCLSKGLGAPVGSLLLGSLSFIKEAKRVRKVMGGGMRQAGMLAAAGLYALQHHVGRLKLDHDHAKQLEIVLKQMPWVDNILPVETNIVILNLANYISAQEIVAKMAAKHIKVSALSNKQIRLVTHLDISSSEIDYTCDVLKFL